MPFYRYIRINSKRTHHLLVFVLTLLTFILIHAHVLGDRRVLGSLALALVSSRIGGIGGGIVADSSLVVVHSGLYYRREGKVDAIGRQELGQLKILG